MKIIINSRKYKLPTQYEMLDLGLSDEYETKEEVIKALKELDKIVEGYREELNKCCSEYPNCSCTQPVKKPDVPF